MAKTMKKLSSENTGETGIAFHNPTHLEEAREAADQSELVNMLHDSKYNLTFKDRTFTVDYKDGSKKPKPLPGVTKIKSMDFEDYDRLEKLMLTILKSRPRIYRLHIILGDYAEKKKVKTAGERFINTITKPRSLEEVAGYLAKVFANNAERIVEMSFRIKEGSFQDKTFRAELNTWATTEEEWNDEDKEHPFLEIGYFGSH